MIFYNPAPLNSSRNVPAPRAVIVRRRTMIARMAMMLVVGLVLAADTPKEKVMKEMERFQGTWKLESMEANGMKVPEETFKNSKLVIKGDQFTFSQGDVDYKGSFKVDVAQKPKTIDITFTDGPEKGNTIVGIYELEGDTYKVCLSENGKDRPKEFASKAGSGHVLEVLKREKR
jgi:uncharacterized protein (TIGR03067 family)